MQEMETQGKRFGVEENPLREVGNTVDYSFPVERKEFLSSPRHSVCGKIRQTSKERMHTGIDIRCDGDTVLATEKKTARSSLSKTKAMHPVTNR